MRHGGAAVGQPAAVVLVEVDRMAVERAGAQQAVAVVHVQVAARIREQLGHPFHLVAVLGHVGLDEGVRMGARQFAAGGQLRLGGGRREARRDGVGQPALVVPLRDQVGGVPRAALGRVAQEFGAVAVHQHLARDHAQVAVLARAEQRVCRRGVHRAPDHRRGGAVAQQLVGEELGHGARVGGLAEAAFLGEGVGVEPVQQARRRRRDDVGLRIVHVGVDETRHEQLAAMVDHLGAGRDVARQVLVQPYGGNAAVRDEHQAIFPILIRLLMELRIAQEVEDAAADGAGRGGIGGSRGHLLVSGAAGPGVRHRVYAPGQVVGAVAGGFSGVADQKWSTSARYSAFCLAGRKAASKLLRASL
ncbi:hypothetical protein D3C86_1116900 [compost metagenome]